MFKTNASIGSKFTYTDKTLIINKTTTMTETESRLVNSILFHLILSILYYRTELSHGVHLCYREPSLGELTRGCDKSTRPCRLVSIWRDCYWRRSVPGQSAPRRRVSCLVSIWRDCYWRRSVPGQSAPRRRVSCLVSIWRDCYWRRSVV